MTSNIRRIEPPLPIGTRDLPLPPSRTASQTFQPTPRSWPRQASTPNPNALVRINRGDASEPPSKKQKLEDISASPSKTAVVGVGGTARLAAVDHATNSERATCIERQEKEPRVHQRPLFPLRPGRNSLSGGVQQGRALAIERAARRDTVPIKPYVPEPPSCAPRYHDAGPADFSPWTGHHPEDVLNELTTKQGYHDKAQAAQSESSTARPSVWSSLKHKSGLQILSSLLVSALDQRQIHGTITANSTFKPPPRVTLTDTKREAWLRDLANPQIPLRRLSRTIPHGIRGKILLDHCLSKNIPTSRAIWLAKCVGANEIRAFKRKGTGGVFTVGGEVKWIRDWTTNIEQFLESIIGACGSPEWRTRINYGLRLASHLYSERLLDRDHYLDWLMASIEDSDLDSLPIWLLVLQIHQQEILQHGQRGRRLACAVLEHLYMAKLPASREAYDSVLQQLVQLSRFIIITTPSCFLLPNSWNRHKDNIRDCVISQEDDQMRSCFEGLSRRNSSLQAHSSQQNKQLERPFRQRVINLLDSLSSSPNFDKVAVDCLRPIGDNDVLVKTCIEWSSSVYRHGYFRIYAAARLLRIWSRHGIELQRPVFDFLSANSHAVGLHRRDLYKLVAALVFSKHLSVGKYLQWLMARGTLHRRREHGVDRPCDVGLLFELPLQGLPSHVLNLRQILLSSSFGFTAEQETRITESAKSKLADQIPNFFPAAHLPPHHPTQDDRLVHLSQTVKYAIARYIRQTLLSRLESCNAGAMGDPQNEDPRTNEPSNTSRSVITSKQFQAIRHVLEDLEDFTILADVLSLVSNRVHGPVMTAVTDTVNHYFDTFNAIGAADDLFQKLYLNVAVDHGQELDNAFLESLVDLGCRLPDADECIRRLRKEMSAHAPKSSAAACSPISDTMVEAMQTTEPTFADEMDQMLASGTSMDKQTLTRVFRTIIGHLEKSFDESSHLVVRFSQLLARLRDFGPKAFAALLKEWLQLWVQASAPGRLSTTMPPLICSKVTSLEVVLQAILRTIKVASDQDQRANLALDALDLVTEANFENMMILDCRRYRLLDERECLIRSSPISILMIMRVAVEACEATDSSTRTRAENQIKRDTVRDLVHSILLQKPEAMLEIDPAANKCLGTDMQIAVCSILLRTGPSALINADLSENVMRVLDDVSGFNISLSQLELKAILASTTISPEHSTTTLSKIIVDQASTSTDSRVDLWAYLVSGLSANQASSIRNRAESEILSWAVKQANAIPGEHKRKIPGLVSMIEASAFSVPIAEVSPLVEQIADVLMNLLPSPQPGGGGRNYQRAGSDYEYERIDVLLRLLVVHQSTIQHPKYAQNLVCHLLITLSLLLIHPLFISRPNLSTKIFDVLAILAGSLSDDTRSRCIRTLRDQHRTRDARLRFIFGYSDTVESEWLQLTTSSSPAAEARPEEAATTTTKAYPLRRWEVMQDATPVATENDTSLSLTLFGSRKSVL